MGDVRRSDLSGKKTKMSGEKGRLPRRHCPANRREAGQRSVGVSVAPPNRSAYNVRFSPNAALARFGCGLQAQLPDKFKLCGQAGAILLQP